MLVAVLMEALVSWGTFFVVVVAKSTVQDELSSSENEESSLNRGAMIARVVESDMRYGLFEGMERALVAMYRDEKL